MFQLLPLLLGLDPVTLFLLIMAGILFIGVVGEMIFVKTKIPDVLWLVIIGALLVPIGGIVEREVVWNAVPFFSVLALIIILFDGGLHLNIRSIIAEGPKGFFLAIAGFLLSVIAITSLTTILAYFGYLQNWSLMNGLLLGSIIGGSSSLIVMPLMKISNLRKEVSTLLSVESATTDALCVVVVIALIDFMLKPGMGFEVVGQSIIASFSVGAVIGGLIGVFWMWFQKFLKGTTYSYMLTFALLLLTYVIVEFAKGSPAVAVLVFGLVFGNSKSIGSVLRMKIESLLGKEVQVFNAQVSFFIKTFFFAFIGMLLVFETQTVAIGIMAAVALFLIRPLAVKIGTIGGKFEKIENQVIAVCMPRGLAAAVLAVYPISKGVKGAEPFLGIVFVTVVISIIIFTFGMWVLLKKAQTVQRKNK